MVPIKQKIKEYYFINPSAKLRVRHIEKKLNIPLPSVIRYCKELQQEHILTTYSIQNVHFYTSNTNHAFFLLEKKLYNIKSLYTVHLIPYLVTTLSNPTIVLFGSYAKGQDFESSDIDIYIETPTKKKIDITPFETKLQRNIHIFRHKSLKEVPNIALVNNIINGIVLHGYIQVLTDD